jgi:hypothetical protein
MTGADIRYPERLLTDPHKRIFGEKKPLQGGIVVIDVSGSMMLADDDVKMILDSAPGALVILYSHKPKSLGIPNVFVVADRGKQVADLSTVKYQNGGNGVDGPVLEYAIKRRIRNEPIIWVCDGQVTGKTDRTNAKLKSICAKLVTRHKITTARTVGSAVSMLKKRKYVSEYTMLTPAIEEEMKLRKGF